MNQNYNGPIFVQSEQNFEPEIVQQTEPKIQMFDETRFSNDQEFAIYRGLESAIEDDDDALNSYLTQNLMNYQLISPKVAQKTNQSEE